MDRISHAIEDIHDEEGNGRNLRWTRISGRSSGGSVCNSVGIAATAAAHRSDRKERWPQKEQHSYQRVKRRPSPHGVLIDRSIASTTSKSSSSSGKCPNINIKTDTHPHRRPDSRGGGKMRYSIARWSDVADYRKKRASYWSNDGRMSPGDLAFLLPLHLRSPTDCP